MVFFLAPPARRGDECRLQVSYMYSTLLYPTLFYGGVVLRQQATNTGLWEFSNSSYKKLGYARRQTASACSVGQLLTLSLSSCTQLTLGVHGLVAFFFLFFFLLFFLSWVSSLVTRQLAGPYVLQQNTPAPPSTSPASCIRCELHDRKAPSLLAVCVW